MAEALTVALVAAIAWGCWREWSVRRLRGRVAMAVRELSETRRLQFKSNEEAMALVKTCWEMQIDGMRRTNDAWMQLFAAKKLIHRLGRMVEAGRRRLRLSRRACRNLNRACDEADARWHRDVGRLTADRDEWKTRAEIAKRRIFGLLVKQIGLQSKLKAAEAKLTSFATQIATVDREELSNLKVELTKSVELRCEAEADRDHWKERAKVAERNCAHEVKAEMAAATLERKLLELRAKHEHLLQAKLDAEKGERALRQEVANLKAELTNETELRLDAERFRDKWKLRAEAAEVLGVDPQRLKTWRRKAIAYREIAQDDPPSLPYPHDVPAALAPPFIFDDGGPPLYLQSDLRRWATFWAVPPAEVEGWEKQADYRE